MFKNLPLTRVPQVDFLAAQGPLLWRGTAICYANHVLLTNTTDSKCKEKFKSHPYPSNIHTHICVRTHTHTCTCTPVTHTWLRKTIIKPGLWVCAAEQKTLALFSLPPPSAPRTVHISSSLPPSNVLILDYVPDFSDLVSCLRMRSYHVPLLVLS